MVPQAQIETVSDDEGPASTLFRVRAPDTKIMIALRQAHRRRRSAMLMAVAATAVGQVPHVGQLFAGEAVLVDEELSKPAQDMPAPASAAARAFLLRMLHRIVIGALLIRRQRQVVAHQEFLRETSIDVVGIGRNDRYVAILLETLDLLAVAMERHRPAARALQAA